MDRHVETSAGEEQIIFMHIAEFGMLILNVTVLENPRCYNMERAKRIINLSHLRWTRLKTPGKTRVPSFSRTSSTGASNPENGLQLSLHGNDVMK